MNLLVGCATAHGSTRTIAETMACVLRRAGLTARARPMTETDDAAAYRALVLGSAVHGQSRLPPAHDFVRDSLRVLGSRPVWIFSVVQRRDALGAARAVAAPHRQRGTGGRARPARRAGLPRPPSVLRCHHPEPAGDDRTPAPASGGGRFGDYRDWDAVEKRTDTIAEELKAGRARLRSTPSPGPSRCTGQDR
ncbi:flavodoxin domain-containing protein [Streptomyces sp. NPDC085946]|uniref:flavodoxin domain-containing protein n=1 Tax=Streptomyces sp. NPDC085946 TaxID=3365744 RepID=UPI0037D15270